MLHVSKRLAAIVAAIMLVCCAAPQAEARKLVGMVFDDSGSMVGRANLPVFGLQVLTASLSSSDSLYGLTFKQYLGGVPHHPRMHEIADQVAMNRMITPMPLSTVPDQERSIVTVRGWAREPNVYTPLGPVLTMLTFLCARAQPDDDVHMFLFTDGAFNNGDEQGVALPRLPPLNAIRASLEQMKARLKAPRLTVHVVVFGDEDMQQVVREQGVMALMTEIFNGQANENVIPVNEFDRLKAELVKVVARISETEHEGNPAVIRVEGQKIFITPPFSVTKLIALSTSLDEGSLPRPTGLPRNIPAVTPFIARMDASDTNDKLPNSNGKRLSARITHMQPYPALEANKEFAIEFDRALTADTKLLFRSDIKIDWVFVDTGGAEIRPDASGVVTLVADREYEIRAAVLDPQQPGAPASLKRLSRDAEFTLSRTDAQRRVERTKMTIDAAQDRATTKVTYRDERTDDVSVSLRVPGFVTAAGRRITVKVIRANVDILLEATPAVTCPGCSGTRVEVPLSVDQPWTAAMQVTARFTSKGSIGNGKVVFALARPLPPGIRIRVPAANTEFNSTRQEVPLNFAMADRIAMHVEVEGRFLDTLPQGFKVEITARLEQPLVGSAGISFQVVPKPEAVQLVFAGNTDGGVGDAPFKVKPDGFADGTGFFVRVEKTLGEVKPDQFEVSIGGLRARIVPQPQKNLLLVVPSRAVPFDCCVRSGRYPIEVKFKNDKGQSAVLSGAMFVEPISLMEKVLICLWLIIAVLATAWLIWGFITLLRSHRFPTRSRFLVYAPRDRGNAEIRRLASRPWPLIKPFVMPFANCNERRTVSGVALQAGSGGALILPKKTGYDHIKRAAERKPISEYFKDGQKQPLEYFWGERLEEMGDGGRTYEIVASTKDL